MICSKLKSTTNRLIVVLLLLFVGSMTLYAQQAAKQTKIYRNPAETVFLIEETGFDTEGNILSMICYDLDENGNKKHSERIEYSRSVGTETTDSVLTYYVYRDGGRPIQDKIVTFTFDNKRDLLITERTQHVNESVAVYPSELISEYFYNKQGRVVKVKSGHFRNNKPEYTYVSKISYKNNNISEKSNHYSYDNEIGRKRFQLRIPRINRQCDVLSTIDANERLIYKKEHWMPKTEFEEIRESRYKYDDNGNLILIKTDFYSKSKAGEKYLHSEMDEHSYESDKLKRIIHYKSTSPDDKAYSGSEEFIYE